MDKTDLTVITKLAQDCGFVLAVMKQWNSPNGVSPEAFNEAVERLENSQGAIDFLITQSKGGE